MTNPSSVCIVATNKKGHLTLRTVDDMEIIGDILLHPSEESRSRLEVLLKNKNVRFGDSHYSWLRGLLHSSDPWPLLFLRDNPKMKKLGPEFFSEPRSITLLDLHKVEGPLVPEEERRGYADQLVAYGVAPVSRALRGKLIQREGQEPSIEALSEVRLP